MRRIALIVALSMIALSFVCSPVHSALSPSSVQKMSVDGLKAQLGSPDVIVLDVRTAHDWDESKTKIKGAIRADFNNPSTWVDKYPKDKTIVFYCK